ncbi:hypothetical protein D8674_042954 [Pyrus ussuriensis x Pyrus communis]|uniref:Response regulatory domain-containing protein n=1 Tax=Pyrus ussuriensis x Pyrus communis TaxID=2448454 RepID=A0A5N5FQG1_9ROSA|nr:hypothetical protein D8674_042954 [Pyrus ussuriensis x Pyrus communis]
MSLIQASGSRAFSVALSFVVIVLASMEDMSPKESNGLPSFARYLRILVVDHDTLPLMSTASRLKKYSFKVTTTALASVALSMIREQKDHYDLVMANISMPDKHRFSFLRVLHKNKIPVIFMSSEVNINVAKKALAEGACFFLQKPISLEDLKNVWQHVYRKVRNPRKDTHKPNCAKKIDKAGNVLRLPTGGIRIHEVGGVCRPTAVHDLCLDAQNTRSLRCKSGKVRRGEGNRQRELQCSHAEQQIATENHTKGAFGIKRPVDDKEEQEKAKKVRLNIEQTVSGSTNKDEEGKENKDCNGSSEDRRYRTIWTPELHLKFTAALRALGYQNARPKSILKWMNVPNITLRQVASHLQKYRKQVQEIQEAGTTRLPSLSRPYSWNSRNEFPPARKTSLICRPYEQGTSTFGVQGNPAQLMTPNSFTRFSDYRRQNPYSEHTVMSHNANHQSESLYDFYLRTHGKFQNLDQIIETNGFTLGAGMNEIERNQPLGLEEIMFKASERNLQSTNYMTPEFGSPYIPANTFQVLNASVSMNQAQNYCPEPTAPFNAQNQDHFSAEATRTAEVGLNQAQFYAPAPTTPINSQNQSHFSAEATRTTEVGMNQAQFYAPAPTTPINSQHQCHFSAEATRTTEVGMNQAQYYAPAPTTPINSQNQNHFSAEATGTTEVGMNQAQFYAPALTTPINSQNQNYFSADVMGTTEAGMNQPQYYTPAPTAPLYFQSQNHFSAEVTGTTDVLEVVPEQIPSVNATNAETFPSNFTGGSQELDAAAREAHPASSNNNQPMSEYDDLLKLLEEDPEKFNWFEPFDSAPNAGDANCCRE